MSNEYVFTEPTTIRDAKDRMRELHKSIASIETSLGDAEFKARRTPEEYRSWRSRARWKLYYQKQEYMDLRDWIVDRRRSLDATDIEVTDANDTREIMVKVRHTLKDILQGRDPNVGQLFNVIDQHLQHEL